MEHLPETRKNMNKTMVLAISQNRHAEENPPEQVVYDGKPEDHEPAENTAGDEYQAVKIA